MPIKILVIDDDSAVTDLLSLLLRSQGFDVTATNNSTDGLSLIREESPDVVVLDLMMPGMDGLDVCRELRKSSGVPIIMITARGEEIDRVVGLAHLKCLHLNDSRVARGSRIDRHAWIGEGAIGPDAFRRIMRDPNLVGVIKIIETPKADDPVRHDRRMLRRLRAYARGTPSTAC